ncbi:hypothetical protein TeGR_g6718, partial [Tetraparma gracilis]
MSSHSRPSAPPTNPLSTPRTSTISSAFLSHVAETAEAQRLSQEQQQKQAESLRRLQDELHSFIRSKNENPNPPPLSTTLSRAGDAADARLQQVQQTQADRTAVQTTLEFSEKLSALREENELLQSELRTANEGSSSSSFTFGIMELLLILQPNLVLQAIASPSFELKPHFTNHPNSTLLFADISGYTALAQSLGAAGAEGTEALSSALDDFFSIAISSIYRFGGDVVKFCGDAILCVFAEDQQHHVTPSEAAMQAVRCSLDLKKKLRFFKAGEVELDLKQMLAHGTIVCNFVGDTTLGHFEFLTTGQPLQQ